MAMTLSQVQTSLAAYYSALDEVAKGRSVTINGRSWTAEDSGEIRKTIGWLERRETQLQNVTAGRSRLGASVARFR